MKYARLFNHDYKGTGFYFVTFSTKPRRPLFSEIINGRIHLKPEGETVLEAWRKIPEDEPSMSLRLNVIMPDHFHGILVCSGGAKMPLGSLIRRMKARSSQAIRRLRRDATFQVWESDYHDYVAFSPGVFENFATYVNENPARWQLRHDNPQWFQKHAAISHPRLPKDTTWTAYGDQTILAYPWLLPVVISRRLEESALRTEVEKNLALIQQGAIAIGGFISPGEQLVAKAISSLPRARMIVLLPWGLGKYKPHGLLATERLATGKTLVLSGFPDSVEPIAARDNCLRNNRWCKAIAAAPVASPGPPLH